MPVDVQDPKLNLLLSSCFLAILLLAAVAIVPWEALGNRRWSGWLRWLAFPVVGLGAVYEWLMPSNYNIRVDLLLLFPAYIVTVLASAVRAIIFRRRPVP